MWLLPLCTQHCAPGLTPRTLPRSTGKFGGSTSSFLFSITKDCKLPYHGRVKGPKQEGDPDDTPAPDGLGMGFGGGGASRAGGAASRGGGFARSEAGRDDGGSAYGGSERGDSEWGGDADDDYGSMYVDATTVRLSWQGLGQSACSSCCVSCGCLAVR